MKTGPKPKPDLERFLALIVPDDDTDCLFWTGKINNYGYGQFRIGSQTNGTRRHISAHRFAFIITNGREPVGVVDHTCHNADPSCPGGRACLHRRCVRGDHLQDVEQLENLRRGRERVA